LRYCCPEHLAPLPTLPKEIKREECRKLIIVIFLQAGHFERPPYNESDIRSIYHVREYDVYRLLQIEEPIDIFLSHDWPIGITDCGNWRELVQKKPFFEKEVFSVDL